jgi:pimeloyl-ACP methyl ester carboxylesterase
MQAPGAPPGRWVLFLHGFLGAGRNWASIGRGLVEARPDWGVVLVDLRLHGDSQGLAPPHTVATSASDVNSLALGLQGRETAIVGHSFGGKVALAAARAAGTGLRQVWIIDSTPAAGRTEAGADRLLALLSRLPGPFSDRADVVDAVRGAGFNIHIAEWTATNLVRGPEGYRWKFDLAALELLLQDFYREDLWSVVEPSVPGRELIFVRATHGSIMTDDAATRIRRLEADGECVRLLDIEGGHWLNMANPDGLLELLAAHLPR